MQNISAISLGDQMMVKMVSATGKGNVKESGQSFQTFMDGAGSGVDYSSPRFPPRQRR